MRLLNLLPLVFCAMLPGCSKSQDFDEKYRATDTKLKADMKRLDGDIDAALKREPGEAPSRAQKDTADE